MSRQLYRLSVRLTRAIRRDPQNQTAIAFPHGLTQSQLSLLLGGQLFSPVVLPRVESLGASYGLTPEQCWRRTDDRGER